MIIPVQFGFSQFISFREEDLWNFGQSEHIIGLGSHIEYPTGTKNSNFVEDHPRNIPAKFGSNRPSGFGEEAWNVKSLQTTDDGRQVMAIVHMDLWSRWTNKQGWPSKLFFNTVQHKLGQWSFKRDFVIRHNFFQFRATQVRLKNVCSIILLLNTHTLPSFFLSANFEKKKNLEVRQTPL